jgi:hypothetical protein
MQLDDQELVSPLGGDLELHRAEANVTPDPEADPYAALEAQFKAAEADRDAARAEAAAEKARAEELRTRVAQHEVGETRNHKVLIEQAMVVTQTAVDYAKERYRKARLEGDIDEELAATEALTDARDQLRQLKTGHEQVVEAVKRPPAPPAPTGDPVETYIDANFAEPRDREWLRLHKADVFGGDEKRKQLAILGDQTAALKGLRPGTDAYYAFLDAHMGYDATDEGEEAVEASTPAQRPATPAVKSRRSPGAPPARNGDGKAPAATGATPEIVALARDLGMSPAKYMEYQAGLAEGKYPGYRLIR